MKNELKDRLIIILSEVFPNSILPDNIDDLKIEDLSDWDSLGNFNLLLAVEEEFSIRFSLDNFSEVKSVKQIVDVIERLK
jgi:acyl carrier protein